MKKVSEEQKKRGNAWKEKIARNQGKFWGDLSNFLDAYEIQYRVLDDVVNTVGEGIYIPSPLVVKKEAKKE